MNLKLQILVPRHNETEEEMRPLLQSIALQQGVDMESVGVIIADDGSDEKLDEDFYKSFPFHVMYIDLFRNLGVSNARNVALHNAWAEYVMFADADDMFCDACGLWLIMREIRTGFDGLISCFTEELKKDGQFLYLQHDRDSTFIHGKVWRRSYLMDNQILFDPKLRINEDSYFVSLATSLTENLKYITNAFWLWRWRDGSVCRRDQDHNLKTYQFMIDSNDALIRELIRRDREDLAAEFARGFVLDVYYEMQKPVWNKPVNTDWRELTEARFFDWWKMWGRYWDEDKAPALAEPRRKRAVMLGMGMEKMSLGKWLSHIEEDI